jgi:ubiquinone/menaquinone biosynthesis C-methylase UbiE
MNTRNQTIYDQINRDRQTIKRAVKEHWEAEPCEVRAGKSKGERRRFFQEIDDYRYGKNSFIPSFAKFEEARNLRVLEIGLGSGSDFIRWARSGAELWGRDLTQASVDLTKERLALEGLSANVATGDAEALDLPSNYFDVVYSYGVLHHTPDTPQAIHEVHRVTKPGGTARMMIYNARGLVFFYEWLVLCAIKGKIFHSIREAVFYHNESLGTKLYTIRQARDMCSQFRSVRIRTVVTHGDALDWQLSDRYRKMWLLRMLKRVSRPLKYLKPLIPSAVGAFMLIEATK